MVVFNHENGEIEPNLPPHGTGLRWPEFIQQIALAYDARFGVV